MKGELIYRKEVSLLSPALAESSVLAPASAERKCKCKWLQAGQTHSGFAPISITHARV